MSASEPAGRSTRHDRFQRLNSVTTLTAPRLASRPARAGPSSPGKKTTIRRRISPARDSSRRATGPGPGRASSPGLVRPDPAHLGQGSHCGDARLRDAADERVVGDVPKRFGPGALQPPACALEAPGRGTGRRSSRGERTRCRGPEIGPQLVAGRDGRSDERVEAAALEKVQLQRSGDGSHAKREQAREHDEFVPQHGASC